LLQHSWLRGSGWLQGKDEASWEASQDLIRQIWKKQSTTAAAAAAIRWDPLVHEAVDKAVQGISWSAQLERLNKEGLWTLVHGDFWPGNVMWPTSKQKGKLKLLDFEMVGLGSGPQDLGQYVLSNFHPSERRACERELVQTYWQEIQKQGVDVTWEYVWHEYRVGGVERWLWFLVYFLGQEGHADWAQFFHDQIAGFMQDHSLTASDMTQTRP
jgi:thiamine kinase-like enzyme